MKFVPHTRKDNGKSHRLSSQENLVQAYQVITDIEITVKEYTKKQLKMIGIYHWWKTTIYLFEICNLLPNK